MERIGLGHRVTSTALQLTGPSSATRPSSHPSRPPPPRPCRLPASFPLLVPISMHISPRRELGRLLSGAGRFQARSGAAPRVSFAPRRARTRGVIRPQIAPSAGCEASAGARVRAGRRRVCAAAAGPAPLLPVRSRVLRASGALAAAGGLSGRERQRQAGSVIAAWSASVAAAAARTGGRWTVGWQVTVKVGALTR